jgi:hypothetical protein
VHAALPSWALKAPGLSIDGYPDRYSPDYYFFLVTVDNPGGSGTVGHFAVDPKTGDVWDGVVCEEYKTPTLTKLQFSIRKRLGLSDSVYRGLKRPGPLCVK